MHTKDVQLRDHSSRPAVCIPETSVDTYIALIHVAPRAHLLRSQMWLKKKPPFVQPKGPLQCS